MSVTNWNSVTAPALFGVAALAISSQAAIATPTTLVCSNDTRPDFGGMTVDLDEAGGTATINYPARTEYRVSPPQTYPAHSVGPFRATFDVKQVVFDQQDQTGSIALYAHYTIDRLTGALFEFSSMYAPFNQAGPRDRVVYQYTCHVGHPQF